MVAFFHFLSFFPLPVLHLMGIAGGWLAYLLSSSYRREFRKNIARAGHSKHLCRAISEAGKSMMELPFIWCANPQRVLKTLRIENWEVLQQAVDQGKGVIALTPHLGCFEIVAQAIAQRTPLTALYRPPRKEALKPLVEGARARDNLHLAPASLAGVRMLLKALRSNQVIGLLPDQVPQFGEGSWIPFFGHPAYTMTLPGKLQQMSGAPLILSYAERLSFGRGYVLRFATFDEELGETPEERAFAMNRAMEKLIARCPAQYIWSYKRYKIPAGVEAPKDPA